MKKHELQGKFPEIFEKYTVRPFTLQDSDALADLYNDYSVAATGAIDLSREDMHEDMQEPGLNLETDTLLLEDENGRIHAAMMVLASADLPVRPMAWGAVHPDFEGRGMGSFLMEWSRERCMQYLEKIPQDARLSMNAWCSQDYPPARKLYEDFGLEMYRQSLRMLIEFDGEQPLPGIPPGFSIRGFDPDLDLEKVYRVREEAFRDHFGHVEESFEQGFARFKHTMLEDSGYAPQHWLIAEEGDQIAGFLIARKWSYEDQDFGYIGLLGVRRPWRGRGLAGYLLRKCFHNYYLEGKKGVALHVDGSSLTGALGVYERAGMHVDKRFDRYEIVLRDGVDLSTIELEEEE